MSYDIHMGASGAGWDATIPDTHITETYNVALIFRRALGGKGIRDLDGLTGAEAAPRIRAALVGIDTHRDEYEAMDPASGYGSTASARATLVELLVNCDEYPTARVLIR